MSGTQSSVKEHLIPEQLFSTTDNPVQAVSAIKALSIAGSEGQRIFTLTQSNIGQLSNITLDTATRTEIANALYAGKEVTVHENPINAFGWRGTGYIISDPETGGGAYKISGGFNGGSAEIDWGMLGTIGKRIFSIYKDIVGLFSWVVSAFDAFASTLEVWGDCEGASTVGAVWAAMWVALAWSTLIVLTLIGAIAFGFLGALLLGIMALFATKIFFYVASAGCNRF